MTDDPSRAGPGSSLAAAHLLLARALRAGFAGGAELAKEAPPGTRVGCDLEVAGDRATVSDTYLKLPDGTRHGVRRPA